MSTPRRYCTEADLELSLGGAQQLVQLLDKDGDNAADVLLVNKCIDAASGEIVSHFVNIDLATLKDPYPPVLVAKTAEVAAFWAWRYGAYGQPIPDSIVQGYDKAVQWARDIGTKGASFGMPEKPSLEENVGVVDHDENGTGISITAFKRGFR